MLNLHAVKTQIDRMVEERQVVQEDFRQKLALALREHRRWAEDWELLARKVEESRTSWLLPGIDAPLDWRGPRPARPAQISVAATDGSQIFPDRHEVSACYLINIGYILLSYGTGERPLMSSKPTLFHREENLYEEWGGRRVFVNRELVGFRRSMMELTELAELALAAREEGHRVIALSDGTLIQWTLEGKPQDFREVFMGAMLGAFEELRQARIPVAGYISRSGSRDLINALKVGLCPLERADCDRCPWKPENQFGKAPEETEALKAGLWQGRGLPCSPFDGLSDALLLHQVLQPGERTAVFRSGSKILEEYGDHWVHFFYVHVGPEIARVELPQWVAEDQELLDLVHACVCDQAEKGQGYPVSLAEAHERAVVRGADREAFYRFLHDTFVKNDIRVGVSSKSLKKRHPGI